MNGSGSSETTGSAIGLRTKALLVDRSHNPWREADRRAAYGKSVCAVRCGGGWRRAHPGTAPVLDPTSSVLEPTRPAPPGSTRLLDSPPAILHQGTHVTDQARLVVRALSFLAPLTVKAQPVLNAPPVRGATRRREGHWGARARCRHACTGASMRQVVALKTGLSGAPLVALAEFAILLTPFFPNPMLSPDVPLDIAPGIRFGAPQWRA